MLHVTLRYHLINDKINGIVSYIKRQDYDFDCLCNACYYR